MNKDMRFLWVDDNPARIEDAKNLEDALKITVDFKDVNKKDLDNILGKIKTEAAPNLIIMDHSLDLSESETYKTGSTAAAYLHEVWPDCPIISVTAVDINDVDIRHRSAYETMIPANRISQNYETILSIAEGFVSLKEKHPKDVESLLMMFKPPKDTVEKLKKILPKELKENFEDQSLLLEVYRWSVSVLFDRPGFLYDELWAATFLGLNIKGFNLIKDQMSAAKYIGVFSDKSKERWWKDLLLEELARITGDVGLPWEIGHKLVGAKKEYFSKCFASAEYYPETVAAEDMTYDAKWYPMKLKYTEPHPSYEDMLFFEELRIMKPAE
ncbi:hypothetical protein [Flagellimonas sp.]|uniref:hypothetical protein n=1 Tax=Flagellimonas sp. TaxID=2058762 RepID=UPI003B512843